MSARRFGLIARIDEGAFGPAPAKGLWSFRWLFTSVLAIHTLVRSRHAREWLTGAGYHPAAAANLSGEDLHPWLPLLPGWAAAPFLVLYLGSMAAILAGFRPRLFSALVSCGLVYTACVDPLTRSTVDLVFVTGWVVLVASPPIEREGQLRSAWPLRLLQAALLLQYAGSATCKLSGAWLTDGETLWRIAQSFVMTDFGALLIRTLPVGVWTAVQWTILAFELAAPLAFLIRPLRPYAFGIGVAVHLFLGLVIDQMSYHALQILCFYVLFMDRAWLEKFEAWLRPKVANPTTRLDGS